MATLTFEEQIAKLLNMTVEQYREFANKPQSDFDALLASEAVLEGDRSGLETAFGNDLKGRLAQIAELTKRQAQAGRDSNTQPAKSKAATQLDKDVQGLVDELQKKLGARESNRSEAFSNTFGDSQLDATSDATFARGRRFLENLNVQADQINNSSAAAAELATDASIRGSIARSLFGNPFAEGVEDARSRFQNLDNTVNDLVNTNNNLFNKSLQKDVPLAEITTGFNADISAANASAKALESRLLIDPIQSGLEAGALGVEIGGVNTQQAGAATQFNLATGAIDRQVTAGRFRNTAQTAIDNNLLGAARQLGLEGRSFIGLDPEGNIADPTRNDFQDVNNRSTILGNNAVRSIGQLGADTAEGQFDIPNAVRRGNQQRESAALSLTNQRTNTNRNLQQAGLDDALGTYDGPKQAQEQAARQRATKFARSEAEYRARMTGIDQNGNYSQAVAAKASANYEREVEKRMVDLDVGYKIAVAEQGNVGTTIDNATREGRQKNAALVARGKTLNKELANSAKDIANTEIELDIKGKELALRLEQEPTWTDTQRKQYQADNADLSNKLLRLQDKRTQYNLRVAEALNAETGVVIAKENNSFASDATAAAQRQETRKLTIQREFNEAKNLTDPVAKQAAYLSLQNQLLTEEINASKLAAEAKFRKSPEFENLSAANKAKQLDVISKTYDKQLADLLEEETDKDGKTVTKASTKVVTAKELRLRELKVDQALARLGNKNIQNALEADEIMKLQVNKARGEAELKTIAQQNKDRESRNELQSQVLANQLYQAKQAGTPAERQRLLLEAENGLEEARLGATHLQQRMDLEGDPEYVSARTETQKMQMRVLLATQQEQLKDANTRRLNRPIVDALTDGELLNKRLKLEEEFKQLNDTNTLNRKRRLDRERVEFDLRQIALQTKGEELEADKPLIRVDNNFKITGVRLPVDHVFTKSQQQTLDSYVPNKQLGPDPYVSLTQLNDLTSVQNRTPMYNQVAKELQQMAGDVGFKKLGQDTARIQAAVTSIMNSAGTKNLDSTQKRNNLLDIPAKELVFDGLLLPSREALVSIPKWNDNTPEENLTGLKEHFESKGVTNLQMLSTKIADTMKDVMGTKARLGKFKELGIPEYTELNYTLDVSKTLQSDDRFYEAVPFLTRPIEAVFGLGLKEFPGKVQVDVLSQTAILKLLRGNVI